MRPTARTVDALTLWLACLATAIAGAYLVFGVLGGAIEDQHRAVDDVARRLRADAATLATRPGVERQARAATTRLAQLDLAADSGRSVAHFIGSAVRIASLHGVDVESVDERAGVPAAVLPPSPGSTAAQAPSDGFAPVDLEVVLGGPYRGLIATIDALATAAPAVRIEVVALERGSSRVTNASEIRARLAVAVQRLNDARSSRATP